MSHAVVVRPAVLVLRLPEPVPLLLREESGGSAAGRAPAEVPSDEAGPRLSPLPICATPASAQRPSWSRYAFRASQLAAALAAFPHVLVRALDNARLAPLLVQVHVGEANADFHRSAALLPSRCPAPALRVHAHQLADEAQPRLAHSLAHSCCRPLSLKHGCQACRARWFETRWN